VNIKCADEILCRLSQTVQKKHDFFWKTTKTFELFAVVTSAQVIHLHSVVNPKHGLTYCKVSAHFIHICNYYMNFSDAWSVKN